MKKISVCIFAALLLTACSQQLSGTYVDSRNDAKLTFESGKKLIFESGLSPKVEVNYDIDGKNLKLISPAGTEVFTIADDGSIQGPEGLNFKKQ